MSQEPTTFEALPAEEVERLLPSYSQVSFLAQGGMATVYQGLQTSLERPVAIKILPREFGSDESFRLRFQAEGKSMARLNHLNLVSIFDFGEVDGLLYIVMEFIDGPTLHERVHSSLLEELEALNLCRQIAEGLAHAHEHNILHRDIKPANVLLNPSGIPKLGDFGLAEEEERVEGDDLAFGTPGYTPPEVLANPQSADERADTFAIGVLLYELLTGSVPAESYTPPSRIVQSDPRVDAILQVALQPDPAHRYQSATALATDLKNLHDQISKAPRRKLATGQKQASATLVVNSSKRAATPILATAANQPHAAEATPAPHAANKQAQTVKVGFNFDLLRNLIIICALCAAIFGAWKALGIKQEQTSNDDQKTIEEQARQKRLQEAEATTSQTTQTSTPDKEDEKKQEPTERRQEPKLSPREQLENRKESLLAGARTEFPEGTLKRGNTRFFFIQDPLTWHEAIAFAETYGGHLANSPSDSNLQWLGSQIPDKSDIWLGAGATSRSDWAWLDDSVPFEARKPNTTSGTAGILTSHGILKAKHPSLQLPFFIQWDEKNSHPITREASLQKLAETLDSPTPQWPPGTLSYQERRYLILAGPLTHADASKRAKKAGGILAVPSDEPEAAFLLKATSRSGLSNLWIGGEQAPEGWHWQSNETWEFAQWDEGFPIEDESTNALTITAEGWQNVDSNQRQAGFIIEWSEDAQNASASTSTTGPTGNISELHTQAKKLLTTELASTKSQIKENINAQGMALRHWHRALPRKEAGEYEAAIESYSLLVHEPDSLLPQPDNQDQLLAAPSAAKILTRHLEQQNDFHQKFIQYADKIRLSYLGKLSDLRNDAQTKGLNSQTLALEKEIKLSGNNGEEFLTHLGFAHAIPAQENEEFLENEESINHASTP